MVENVVWFIAGDRWGRKTVRAQVCAADGLYFSYDQTEKAGPDLTWKYLKKGERDVRDFRT